MRAQLIRKWNSLPKEAGSSTMEAFFCQWLYWIPLEGHWAILKAISSITPPHLLLLSLILKVSRGNLCQSSIWSPPPAPLYQMQTLQYFILIIWGEITTYSACLVYSMTAEREQRAGSHTILPIIGPLCLWWAVPDLRHSCIVYEYTEIQPDSTSAAYKQKIEIKKNNT